MARIAAILGTLVRIGARDSKTLASFSGNNLFYIAVTLLFMDDSKAFVSLNVLLAMVLFFPMSTDPLRAIPVSRIASWPLTNAERRALRLLTPWLNPVTWVLAILVLARTVSFGFWALLAGLFAFGFIVPSLTPAERVVTLPLPPFPTRLNQLLRNNLRQLLSTLDFYAALLIAAGALFYRVFGTMAPEAQVPLSLLIVLSLSSYAQCLFGLDGPGAATRYRLLPVRGWQILAAKDAVFLLVNVVLCLPLAPFPALSAASVALAIGHQLPSTTMARKFAGGSPPPLASLAESFK